MYQFIFGHKTQSKCQPGSIMTVLDIGRSLNPILGSSSAGIVIKRKTCRIFSSKYRVCFHVRRSPSFRRRLNTDSSHRLLEMKPEKIPSATSALHCALKYFISLSVYQLKAKITSLCVSPHQAGLHLPAQTQ